jgi:hypothetical protein
LTTGELERLVETTVRRTIEDYLETLEALSSASYLESIREAREDYQRGAVTNLAQFQTRKSEAGA